MSKPLAFDIDHLEYCDGECPTCHFISLKDPVKKKTVLELIARFYETVVPTEKEESNWDMRLEDLGLKTPTLNSLRGSHYETVRNIMEQTVYEVRDRSLRFGPVAHYDLVERLVHHKIVPKGFTFWYEKACGRKLRDLF